MDREFDPSEKKAEIILAPQQTSLLAAEYDNVWYPLVHSADAKILSVIANQDCKAFLLSESSLFVWSDRILLITCGRADLVNAINYCKAQFCSGQTPVIAKIYYLAASLHKADNSNKQHRVTALLTDARLANFCLDDQLNTDNNRGAGARSQLVLASHSWHEPLLEQKIQQQRATKPLNKHKRYELVATGLAEDFLSAFEYLVNNTNKLLTRLGLQGLLAGFVLDHHIFKPNGYSLNAIKQQDYLTIHISPDSHNGYLSITSNLDLTPYANNMLKSLSPNSVDLFKVERGRLKSIAFTNVI